MRIAWTNSGTPFVLEGTDFLFPGAPWQVVSPSFGAVGDEVSVTLSAVAASRFFRLRWRDLAGEPNGDEDDDGLLNADEIARGLNPLAPDSDRDGWSDGVEVADGTDPLNPDSSPRACFVGRPLLDVVLPSFDEIGTTGLGVTMGGPPVEAVFPSLDEVDAGTPGVTTGRPPVEVVFPSLDEADSSSGVTIGRPPLEIVFPTLEEIDSILTGITLGRPPVSIRYVP